MRWLLGLLLVVVLLGLAYFQFGTGPGGPLLPRDGRVGRGGETPEPEGRPKSAIALPAGRGDGAILGTVRRDRRPVAARVEIRLLRSWDPAMPEELRPDWTRHSWLESPRPEGPPIVTTRTAEDGSFLAEGIGPGRFEVRAIAEDDDAAGTAEACVDPSGARVRRDVEIVAGPHTLRGLALYPDGSPFRGLVSADPRRHAWGGISASAVPTDESGRFVVKGLRPGMVRLSCLEVGSYRYEAGKVFIPFEGEYVVTVGARCRKIRGTVLAEEDDRPIAGARVLADGEHDQVWAFARTTTDDEGRFEVLLPDRELVFTVFAEGFSPAYVDCGTEEVVGEVVVRLGREGRLSGRLVAEGDGRPLPGVPVFLQLLDFEFDWAGVIGSRAVTDAGGRFSFAQVFNGEVMVFARGPGWVSRDLGLAREDGFNPLAFRVPPGETKSLPLVAVPAARIRGRVVSGGAPVAGATVSAGQVEEEAFVPFEPLALASDDRGEFEFPSLVPGIAYELTAIAPGRMRGRAGPIRAAPGETLDVEIELGAGRFREISVVEEETGDALAGATVWAFGDQVGPPGRWETGPDGTVRAGPLPSGAFRVYASHPDCLPLVQRPLVKGSSPSLLTIALSKGLVIAGRVCLPAGGQPQAGVVSFKPRAPGNSTPRSVEVGAGGRFRAAWIPPGRYQVGAYVRIDEGVFSGRAFAEAGDEDVVLELERQEGDDDDDEGRIRFRILDSKGRPVPRGSLALGWIEGDEVWWDEYEIRNGEVFAWIDPEGSFWVSVFGARSASGALLPLGAERRGPMTAAGGEVVIRLGGESTIAGSVRGEGGRGLPGVRVRARPTSTVEQELWQNHSVARTDGGGEFRIGRLGPGEYRVRVEVPPGYLPAEPVVVGSGAKGVTFSLRIGSSFRIVLRDGDGEVVPGTRVKVQAEGDDGLYRSSVSDQEGRAFIIGLDPALTYVLKAYGPGSRRDLMPIRVDGWKPADGELTFPVGLSTSGTVRFPAGRPERLPLVWGRSARGSWTSAPVPAEGTFEIGPFPPGPIWLLALKDGERPARTLRKPVESRAGRLDVVLTLEPGEDLTVRIRNLAPGQGGSARLAPLDLDGEQGRIRSASVSTDGTVLFADVPRERRFALYYAPGDGRVAYLTGLRSGGPEIGTNLAAGKPASGRLVFPPGATRVRLFVRLSGFSLPCSVSSGLTWTSPPLPEGKWTAVVTGLVGGQSLKSEKEVRSGGKADLVLGGE